MKNIYSCLLILTFFASCADNENTAQEITSELSSKGGSDILPANNANPYDNAGRIYDELFDAYYDGTNRSKDVQSVIAQVEIIANSNSSFITINDLGYQSPSKERVQYLADRNFSDIASIIGVSNLSSNAKTNFGNFLISITVLYDSETDASKMYSAIVRYEGTVVGSHLLTENDKRVILTTTSIIRYTSYRAKKKPKKNTDPDWIIFIGHVFGTEEGAEENSAKAIVEGLVTGIISNK